MSLKQAIGQLPSLDFYFTTMNKLFEKISNCSTISIIVVISLVYLYLINLDGTHFIDRLVSTGIIGQFLSMVYQACECSLLTKWLTTCLFFTVIIILIDRYLYTPFGRYIMSVFFLFLGIWIGVDSFWIYPDLFYWANLRWIFCISFILGGIALMSLKSEDYFTKMRSSNHEESSSNRFSHESKYETLAVSESLLAIELVDRMQNTVVDDTSFAVGIVGEWGSGKTIFLNTLLLKLGIEHEIVIDYNPWLSMTEKTLVRSFFDKLAEIIKTIDPDLKSPLLDYAKAIVSLDGKDGVVSRIVSLFGMSDEVNIDYLKKRISHTLTQQNRKIYILIDDLDRLSGDELFEVLRLIRNTADFPRIVYIVAYDREYVKSILQKYGIERAGQYLDKIFNVEIDIPKSTANQMSALFKHELSIMGVEVESNKLAIWSEMVYRYLPTFRDVKRFSRTFAMHFSYMRRHVHEDEFLDVDLFHLELLRYVDSLSYTKLRNEFTDFLTYKLDTNGAYRFILPKDYGNDICFTRDPKQLICKIFQKKEADRRSLVYLNNYQRYFTYSLSDNTIRKVDLYRWQSCRDIRSSEDEFKQLIDKAGKSHSLLFQLSMLDRDSLISNLQLISASRYLIDLYINDEKRSGCALNVLLTLIEKSKIDNTLIDIGDFFENVEYDLKDDKFSKSRSKISSILKQVRVRFADLSNQITKLEISNFKSFLDESNPQPGDMADERSTLKVIYVNSIRWTTQGYIDMDGDWVETRTGKSPLLESMMAYFRIHPGQNRNEFYETLFCYTNCDFDGSEYLDEVPEEIAAKIIIDLFGNQEDYTTFNKEAFTPNLS